MRIVIDGLLSSAEVEAISGALRAEPDAPDDLADGWALELFGDGRVTAGAAAGSVKHNLQGRADAPRIKAVVEKTKRALMANSVFAAAALPRQPEPFARVMVSLYQPGMSYGWHSDEAFIDGVRTDLSFTLFLSAPDSYEGGALELENASGTEHFRLAAGSAVVYTSGEKHRVTEVTQGERLAVVGWVQSTIRSTEQRELQFALAALLGEVQSGAPAAAAELAGIRQRLLRMWAD